MPSMVKMGKLWTRIKYRYLRNSQRLPTVVVVMAVAGALYFLYTLLSGSTPSTSDNAMRGGHKIVRTHMTQPEIDAYLRVMRDTSPPECISNIHNNLDQLQKTPVSIIIHYTDQTFYDLKLTLTSLIQHTPKELLTDVIVIDDDSSEVIQKKAVVFFQDEMFKDAGIKSYRSEQIEGSVASRLKGALLAKGPILVFASTDVVFNRGWVEAMITHLADNPRGVGVPHMDNILDGYRFLEIDPDLVTMPTWTLSTLHHKTRGGHGVIMEMPVMTGQMFGINKEFYDSLGGYDSHFVEDDGADLELSLRVWLCGGKIVKLSCSRIGVWNALTPQHVKSPSNIHRIAELWLGEEHKHIVYKQMEISLKQLDSDLDMNVRSQKMRIEHVLYNKCHDFKWYLKNVATSLKTPSSKWVQFGQLRSFAGKCIKWKTVPKDTIELVQCKPPMYETDSLFEYTTAHLIRVDDMCLIADNSPVVRLVECSLAANSHKLRWVFGGDGSIRNEAFQMCLEHLGQNNVVLSHCSNHNGQKWSVVKY